MGKTPKPLRVQIHPSIAHWEEWDRLRAQGHIITVMTPEIAELDLILGPNGWMLNEKHKDYLDNALAKGRADRYPAKRKEEKPS